MFQETPKYVGEFFDAVLGELPVQRIGRAVRIPESAINFLAEPEPLALPAYLKGGAK